VPVLLPRRAGDGLAPGPPGQPRRRRRWPGHGRGDGRLAGGPHQFRRPWAVERGARRGVGSRGAVPSGARGRGGHPAGACRPQGQHGRAVAWRPHACRCSRRLDALGPECHPVPRRRCRPAGSRRRRPAEGRRRLRAIGAAGAWRGVPGRRGARRARVPAARVPESPVEPPARPLRRQPGEPPASAARGAARGAAGAWRRCRAAGARLGHGLRRRRMDARRHGRLRPRGQSRRGRRGGRLVRRPRSWGPHPGRARVPGALRRACAPRRGRCHRRRGPHPGAAPGGRHRAQRTSGPCLAGAGDAARPVRCTPPSRSAPRRHGPCSTPGPPRIDHHVPRGAPRTGCSRQTSLPLGSRKMRHGPSGTSTSSPSGSQPAADNARTSPSRSATA